MNKLLFFILFISISLFIKAQERINLEFIHYSTDQGLSSSEVTVIVQDSLGFIWVGTEDGLNRFDSYTFKVYRKKSNDSTSLMHNYINALFVDSYGELWVGTQHGISIYNNELDAFINYLPDQNIHSNQANFVSSFTEDKEGTVYVSLKDGQIFAFNRKAKTFNLIKNLSTDIKFLFVDSDNNLWVLSDRIFIYDHQMTLIKTIHSKQVTQPYKSMVEDDDKFWVSTLGNGLFWIDKKTKTLIKSIAQKEVYENYINLVYKDNDNNIWIGSLNSLKLYNRESNSFYYYYSDENIKNSMSTSGVLSFIRDREGSYWVLTSKGGVNVSVTKKKFVNINVESKNKISLSKRIVSSILIDSDNNLLVGSFTAGIDLIDFKTQKLTHFEHEKSNNKSIGEGSVLMLYEDSKKNIWVGSYWGGLQIFNKKNSTFFSFKDDARYAATVSGADYRSMVEDKNGILWFATCGKGLIKYDPKSYQFENLRQDPSNSKTGLVNDWLYAIMYDHSGAIWIGSSFGLGMMEKDQKTFTNYFNIEDDSNSLSNNFINCLFEDSKGRIWVGTNEGLNLFNHETKTFKCFKKENGLPNSVIKAIQEDSKGNLWISTSMGISKFDLYKKRFNNYNISDGLSSNEFNPGACAKGKDGKLYFGSNNGIISFHPDSIKINMILVPVYITSFKILNKTILANQENSPLTKDIIETDEIILKHDQASVISFEFVSISYIQSEKKEYAYLMEGFDQTWVYCGNKREATYTNLDPGTYTFKVKASNNDGFWNETGRSVRVIILPPWWETTWFRIFVIMCILSLLIGFYLMKFTNLKKQKIQLQRLIYERTKEIEEKNRMLLQQTSAMNETNMLLEEKQQYIEEQSMEISETNVQLTTLNATKDKFFTIIAHDLKNPFNAILGFCELLLTKYDKYDDEKIKSLINAINDSAKHIFKLLENLLQWSRSQTGSIDFNPIEFNLSEVIDANIALVENLLSEKNLIIQKSGFDNLKVYADMNMISTVVRNLLTNAIKFSENGFIGIAGESDHTFAFVKIIDSGVGISDEKLNDLFDIASSKSTKGTQGETGTGLGLILCKEFVIKNGGSITVESEPGIGSTFKFSIPLIQAI